MKSMSYFIVSLMVIGIFLSMSFTTNKVDIIVNKILINKNNVYVNGNATISVSTHDRPNIEYKILNQKENNLEIEMKEDTLLIKQHIVSKGFLKGFFKDEIDYPIIDVFLPKKIENMHFLVKSNGDININCVLNAQELSFEVVGNGDIKGKNNITVSKCKAMVKGNGDIKLHKINADILDCTVDGNGDIFLNEINAKKFICLVSGNGDIECAKGKTNILEMPNGRVGITLENLIVENQNMSN